MSITLSISEQQAQALSICRQLLDVGEFKLSGKDLDVAVQAKLLLSQVVEAASATARDSSADGSGHGADTV